MRLPQDRRLRHEAVIELARQCSVSRSTRKAYHRELREVYTTGSATETRAIYNKIRSHVKQSSAYLFQSESVRFGLTLPPQYGEQFDQELETARDDFHGFWHGTRAGLTVALGVRWAHVYPSVVFKVIPSAGEALVSLVPDPADIGVLEEDRPFDRQEAIVHFFWLTLGAFRRLVRDHPDEARLMEVARGEAEMGGGEEPLTGTLERIAFDAAAMPGGPPSSSPGVGGGVLINTPITSTEAMVEAPRVLCCEQWVVDDRLHDWRVITCLAPAGDVQRVIWDRRTPVLSGMDPFVALTLDETPDYTWGLSETDDLSALQAWRERRMGQIDLLMELQLDPPIVLGGFGGLSDERAKRLRTPGGTLSTSIPNPNVHRLAPQMPPEAFGEVKEIDGMFADQGGLPILLQGQSEPGIRAGNQVGVLATLASARIRQNAMRVEVAASEIATLLVRLHRELHAEPLMLPGGKSFLWTHIPREVEALVSAHSASPLYAAAIKADADAMLKAGAIDLPTYVELKDPPMVDVLRSKARKLAEERAKRSERLLAIAEMKALHSGRR